MIGGSTSTARAEISLGLVGGVRADASGREDAAAAGRVDLGYRFDLGVEPFLCFGNESGTGPGVRFGRSFGRLRPYVEAGARLGSEDALFFPTLGAGVESRLLGALHARAFVDYTAVLGKQEDRRDLFFGGLGIALVQ